MMRKKIVNKEKFQFREEEILPPRRVNSKNSFQSRLTGKNSAMYHNGHDQAEKFASFKSLPAIKKNTYQDALANQVDTGLPYINKGEKRSVLKDASDASSSLPRSLNRTNDPVLDEIVAKLKSGLQLSNPGSNMTGRTPRHIEMPGQNNNQAGLTNKTPSPSPQVEDCVCLRPLKLVMCEVCGETFCGRVSLKCRVHPRALYLQDLKECKGCKQNNKEALKEFDLPQGMERFMKKAAENKN